MAATVKATFERHKNALEALDAIKLETGSREQLLKRIEKRILEQRSERGAMIHDLPIPSYVRVLVRVKPCTPASATNTAECKGLAALAAARARERQRASLPIIPPTAPDNCEL